ncbi:NUDIX hydrolase [Planococcus maitriensis]|uniref:NUDIX hydrolase n=1 Tax=Planococcus maitriensis TaxID=221799 RepID=A0A365K535_9BACL|nr:NUDIX domain-containing protein [Planococcus maitriensis]RAZ67686.1 NUDIX hydrolase [Planococcus maitriensis]
MAIEKIACVTEQGALTGVAARDEVHRQGLWHETFHCWIVSHELGHTRVHLQLRSRDKADFPGLFDITAAGHIAAHESVKDGVREIEEELGLALSFEQLTPLGVVNDEILLPGFTDRERAYIHLYEDTQIDLADYRLQAEEVAGMAAVDFRAFFELCMNQTEKIDACGFIERPEGRKPFRKKIGLPDFVPHQPSYWKQVAIRIRRQLMDS